MKKKMSKSMRLSLILTIMILSVGVVIGAQFVRAENGDLFTPGGILLEDTNSNGKIDEVKITVEDDAATAVAINHTINEETTIDKFVVTDAGTGNPVKISSIQFVSSNGLIAVFKLVLDETDEDLSADVSQTALDVTYDASENDLSIVDVDEANVVRVAAIESTIQTDEDIEDNDSEEDNQEDDGKDEDNVSDDANNNACEENDDVLTPPLNSVNGPTEPNCNSGITLYKMSGSDRVYVVKNKKKQWIHNPQEFEEKGYKWNEVQEISDKILEQYPDAEEIVTDLIRAVGGNKVYKIKDGKKYWIRTAKEFISAGYQWEKIKDVSPEMLASYGSEETSGLVRVVGENKVYKIKDGKKYWIRTAKEFISAGYSWGDIEDVVAQTLEQYPDLDSKDVSGKIVDALVLRVRNDSSIAGKIIDIVKKSEVYTIYGKKNGWYKIKTKSGKSGWISSTFVQEQ